MYTHKNTDTHIYNYIHMYMCKHIYTHTNKHKHTYILMYPHIPEDT